MSICRFAHLEREMAMKERRKVILITDGDEFAKRTIELIAHDIGGSCISASQGNPTILSGEEMVQLIKKAQSDPVYIMFDDSGYIGEGPGEKAMTFVAKHPDIEVIGAIAVASRTHHEEWTKVDVSIDRFGELTEYGVDKSGIADMDEGRIVGDTVYCLEMLNIPFIVGIGDIGKMARIDSIEAGSPITKQAVELILERSGML